MKDIYVCGRCLETKSELLDGRNVSNFYGTRSFYCDFCDASFKYKTVKLDTCSAAKPNNIAHDYVKYVGLQETFEYCRLCDKRRCI